ncbi:hypothetical protein ACHAWT_000279, partial [Skeletonema menzelii]
MRLYHLLILSIIIYCSTRIAVLAVPFFNKHSCRSTSSSSSSSANNYSHSSLLLQHHRTIYTNRRPHDTSLYDILNVRPNATLAEIQKSWRRKSLLWHPDKVAAMMRRRREEDGRCTIGRDGKTVVVPPPPPPPPPPFGGSGDQSMMNKEQHDLSNSSINNSQPNKQDQKENEEEEEYYAKTQLQKIQHAYEILSDDHNRLLYHKYGLVGGTNAAVQLLTGRAVQSSSTDAAADGATVEQIRLLELMGYHHHSYQQSQHSYPSYSSSSSSTTTSSMTTHQQRIQTLTTTITEYLRPLVEGSISQENFITQVHSEMNALKKSPLGAQVIRCVGRAYKVEGWRVLRQMREEKLWKMKKQWGGGRSYHHSHSLLHKKRTRNNGRKNSRVDDILQDSWRNTKHYASAAYASGKLVVMEQRLKKMEEDQLRQREERRRQRRKKKKKEDEDGLKRIQQGGNESNCHHLVSSNIGSLSDNEEDEEFDIGSFSDIDNNNDSDSDMSMFSSSESESDDDDEIEYELQHSQNQKAYTALLSLHQMEALWKVTKIELDKTVREACRWILTPTPPLPASMDGNGGSRSEGGGWYAFCPSEQSPYQEDWQHYHARPPPPP